MKTSPRLKSVLFAAASLAAVTVAGGNVAADAAPAAPFAIEQAYQVADHDEAQAGPSLTAKKIGIAAAAAAALAGLARLIGFRRIKAAAVQTAKAAAQVATFSLAATKVAAHAVLRAAASPFRFAMLIAGLAFVAFTGIGFYDVEWAAGLVFGALFAGTALLGFSKVRRALAPAAAKVRH